MFEVSAIRLFPAIVNLVKGLPAHSGFDAIWRQLLRSGTGIATSHRACGRARSRREFIARLGLVVEEADETEFWLETMIECRLAPEAAVTPLYQEARELRAILLRRPRYRATAPDRGARHRLTH